MPPAHNELFDTGSETRFHPSCKCIVYDVGVVAANPILLAAIIKNRLTAIVHNITDKVFIYTTTFIKP